MRLFWKSATNNSKQFAVVNALLGILLPFAFTPLVKYNCTEDIMGPGNASRGMEKVLLYSFAIAVWGINAVTLSINGGGFFGDWIPKSSQPSRMILRVLEIVIQLLYAFFNFKVLFRSSYNMMEEWNNNSQFDSNRRKDQQEEEMLPIESAEIELS